MSKELVTDELWEMIESLVPEQPSKDALPRIDDRAALSGILFALTSAIPWEMRCPSRWDVAAPG